MISIPLIISVLFCFIICFENTHSNFQIAKEVGLISSRATGICVGAQYASFAFGVQVCAIALAAVAD